MTERLTDEDALEMAVAVAADTATSMGLKARADATREHWADNAHPVQSALAAIRAIEGRYAVVAGLAKARRETCAEEDRAELVVRAALTDTGAV